MKKLNSNLLDYLCNLGLQKDFCDLGFLITQKWNLYLVAIITEYLNTEVKNIKERKAWKWLTLINTLSLECVHKTLLFYSIYKLCHWNTKKKGNGCLGLTVIKGI